MSWTASYHVAATHQESTCTAGQKDSRKCKLTGTNLSIVSDVGYCLHANWLSASCCQCQSGCQRCPMSIRLSALPRSVVAVKYAGRAMWLQYPQVSRWQADLAGRPCTKTDTADIYTCLPTEASAAQQAQHDVHRRHGHLPWREKKKKCAE